MNVVLHMEKFALSVEEALEVSGIKRDLFYDEINSGHLKTLKIGRRRLVRAEALEQWLKDHEKKTSKAMGFEYSAE